MPEYDHDAILASAIRHSAENGLDFDAMVKDASLFFESPSVPRSAPIMDAELAMKLANADTEFLA